MPSWTPHRLRHKAATASEKKYGIEKTRTLLGHASAYTTEIYAERVMAFAKQIMQGIG